MMCPRFEEWSEQIEKYCVDNGLNFEKAKKLSKCWNKDTLGLQYYDKDQTKGLGLLDETPLPLVLMIRKTQSGLIFEQTEYTRQYLA